MSSSSDTADVVDAADVVAELVAARERGRSADAPPPGRAWCEAATSAVDHAVRRLAAPVVARRAVAIAAVGGYGRRELCPRSDVDLLVLHDRLDRVELERIVRAVVYPLWDAGLTVGYAVHDGRGAVAAVEDLDTATAVADLRCVAGDRTLASRVRDAAAARTSRRPVRFLRALARADAQRRARAGDAAEVLEPDLKDGAGGLRDVQSLRWAAGALLGAYGIDPLVPAGYVAAPDRSRLAHAYDRLLAARVALHLVADDRGEPGKVERLRLDLQDPVAARCGLTDLAPHDLAPHRLLTALYLDARTVDHVHRRAWALIDADAARGRRRRRRPAERIVDGFELVDGVLRLPAAVSTTASGDGPDGAPDDPGPPQLDDPDLPVRLLEALALTGAVLDRGTAARVRSRVESTETPAERWPWTDEARRRFLDVLWAGEPLLPALAELDDVGLVTALLPEWRAVRGRPQRNPFHLYSLDRHAWHAVVALGELVRSEAWAAATLELVDDPDALVLGTLLHDVGKAFGEPHSETGVPVARAVAEHLGASPSTVDRVGDLVAAHLLLPDLARRRDVTDPAVASEVAERVGSRAMLASLHLLAAADGRATGPTAWTDWTAGLVATLVSEVTTVLDETSPEPADDVTVADAIAATRERAVALAPELGADPQDVRDHLGVLPERYTAAVSPRAVVRHAIMAATRPGPTEVRTRVTPGDGRPVPGAAVTGEGDAAVGDDAVPYDELDVVTLDHPGWFAKVAGVVALHGGSILAADAFGRDDGLAVDTFRIRPPDGVGGAWWASVEGDLDEAAAGRLAIRARVARAARGEQHRIDRLPDVPTTFVAEPDPSGTSTIVEIRTLDRLGVLYLIASALAELQLDIVVARIQTLGFEVVDAFYLRDADGGPLDRDHLAELELSVTSALGRT